MGAVKEPDALIPLNIERPSVGDFQIIRDWLMYGVIVCSSLPEARVAPMLHEVRPTKAWTRIAYAKRGVLVLNPDGSPKLDSFGLAVKRTEEDMDGPCEMSERHRHYQFKGDSR